MVSIATGSGSAQAGQHSLPVCPLQCEGESGGGDHDGDDTTNTEAE